MKKILTTVLLSFLGGAITLGAYKVFFEKPQVQIIQESSDLGLVKTTSSAPMVNVDFVSAAERSLNSVVHVKTAVQQRRRYNNPFEEFFFGPGARQPQIQMGSGSGVIVSADGYIVTNNHVVANASEIEVVLFDNREIKANVIGTDPDTDLALIKIDAEDLPKATFANSDDIQVGEWVLAVGNPFNLTNTVTHGIVSAKGRSINILRDSRTAIEAFIQTDAAVNPGNSGGALVNVQGDLVGINTAISSRSGSFEGYSFAVPSNIVKKVVEDILEYGAVQRAFIGVSISDISTTLARELRLSSRNGVYVNEVVEDGAADDAGIKSGDVIVAIDGRNTNRSSELQEAIGRHRPGDKIKVKVLRDGKEKNLEVLLRNREGTTEILKRDNIRSSLGLGANFTPISKEEKKRLNIDHGLVVTEISAGKLMRAGVPKNFVITHIDRKPIASVEDLEKALSSLKPGQGVMLEGVHADGRKDYLAFGW